MATVRIPPILRPEAGNNRQLEVDGETVREVLESLVATYPTAPRAHLRRGDELPQFLNVFIDGSDVRLLDGLETKVADGATVILLPAVAGGGRRDGLAAAPPRLRRARRLDRCRGRRRVRRRRGRGSCVLRRSRTDQMAVRLGAVAAGDRDVELGVAPHAVLGDVEPGLLDLGLGADPERDLEEEQDRERDART